MSQPHGTYAAPPPTPSSAAQQVHLVIAGIAGGVGTTTVAAALARSLAAAMPGQVGMQDHDGGTLFARAGLWANDRHWGSLQQAPIRVQCLGRASNVLSSIPLSVPGMVPIVVAPWHEDGLRVAAGVVQRAATVSPMVLTCDVTHARNGQSPQVQAHPGLVYDRALAAPGPLADGAASPQTQRAITEITRQILHRTPTTPTGLP